MEQKIEKLEKNISDINERNKRVEADKAWEVSWFRVGCIAVLTYVCTAFFLYIIHAENILMNSLITVVGYFISTQSMSFLKKWWMNRFLNK